VSLATLAIPFPVQHPEFERFVETDKGMLEKAQKLANLLFLPQPPTRVSLMRDLIRYGVLNNSITPVQELFEIMENQFNPLDLCAQVDSALTNLGAIEDHDYVEQYVEPIQDVTLGRLIKQISQV
jgi:translation initiation factor 3 subunit A